MNAMITASTTWPAIMLAKRRTAKHAMLHHQPEDFDDEDHRNQQDLERAGNIHMRDLSFPEADRPELHHAGTNDHQKCDKRQRSRHASEAGRRAHPGNHAEQVAAKDEEENRPQEGHEPVGVVMADAGPGHVVAEVKQHCFEHVAEAAARDRAALECSGQTDEKHEDQDRHEQLDHHELRELEVNRRSGEGLRNRDMAMRAGRGHELGNVEVIRVLDMAKHMRGVKRIVCRRSVLAMPGMRGVVRVVFGFGRHAN